METFVFSKIMNNQTQRFSSYLFSVFCLCTAVAAAPARGQAQTPSGDHVSVNLSDPSRPALVKASLLNGGITVKGYDGKEVIVEAHARSRERERGDNDGNKGMHRLLISSSGLTVEEENNEVRINADSIGHPIDLSISVPVHTSLKLSTVNSGDIVVTGVDGELDINDVNGSVTLSNVSGSAIAHALNGRVLVTFARVNQKPMAFSSLNGDIDVTFPADLKADLSLKSDRGEVFSDFDVQIQPSAPKQTVEDGRSHGGKYRVQIDKTVHVKINGGGPELQFTNFNGSIYIRKAGSPR